MTSIGAGELLKDRYRLERRLGHGGMAVVWLGRDEVLDRPVAVKVLADTLASDPGFVTRFRREATTAAGLSHPNLVDVYDFSEEGERPYLVMQFVPGETLAARLEGGEGVDRTELARELLEALDHIHRAGILHRDVKPGNVILEPDGTAKLIDFGIARPLDATALTSTGLVLGTERYAAPEVMAGEPASERSDLYSLGVVLRSCPGADRPDFDRLVEWLADPDPGARPGSAQEALARLERADREPQEPTRAFPVTEEHRPVPPPPAPRRHHPSGPRRGALAALLGVLAVAIVVAVVVFGGGGGGDGGGRQTAKKGAAKQKEGGGGEAQGASSAAPAPEPEPEPASQSGPSLNEQGYQLIQAGEYEAAVPVLEEAVAFFPEGSEDLDYAYALFNLGSALRHSGRPDEAIPVLEERLRIPNQKGIVKKELDAARAEAG